MRARQEADFAGNLTDLIEGPTVGPAAFENDVVAEKLFLKVDVAREGTPSVPSLCALYDTANWQERETYDLLGIHFEGHPDQRRILLWEGYQGWPLRKDYVHTQDMYDNGGEIGLPKAAPAAHGASK